MLTKLGAGSSNLLRQVIKEFLRFRYNCKLVYEFRELFTQLLVDKSLFHLMIVHLTLPGQILAGHTSKSYISCYEGTKITYNNHMLSSHLCCILEWLKNAHYVPISLSSSRIL